MKVLIVDDDVPTVDAIRDLVNWHSLGIDKIFTAYDYAEAQQQIRLRRPDIILCDIEMPKGSGLDLLQWIRQTKLECEFIFLTCHANFDYAKIAIRYGAADYITKPFSVSSTEAVLSKTVNRILYHRQLLAESRDGVRWKDERSLAQQTFLRSLVIDGVRLSASVLEERLKELEIPMRGGEEYRLVLAVVPHNRVPDSWSQELFQYAFRNMCLDLLGNMDEMRVFSYTRNESLCNLVIMSESETADTIHARCSDLCTFCRDHLQGEATCYFSPPCPLAALPESRKDLEQLDRLNIAQRGRVLNSREIRNETERAGCQLDVQRLELLFQQEKVLEIVNTIRSELQTRSSENRLDAAHMNLLQQDLLQVMYTVLSRNGLQAHELFRDAASTRLSQAAPRSVFDMMKWVSFAVDRVINGIRESRKTQSVAGKITRYIRDHYMEVIGRDEVAAAVYLTPDYANRLFKSEMNVSIKEYLNQYRIAQAKRLLMEKGVNIGNVAEQVGFDNFSYFSTIFKKYEGCSPSEFRRREGAQPSDLS